MHFKDSKYFKSNAYPSLKSTKALELYPFGKLFYSFLISFVTSYKESNMLEFLMQYGYVGLFTACFLAATILPFSSDFVFGGLLVAGLAPWPCVVVATLGNWLGGMTNYFLGRLGKLEWIEKYLKIDPAKIEKMQVWLDKKGAYMALFSFVAFVGDIMAVALGYMRANLYIVTICMLIGKFCRYVVVMYAVQYGVSLF